MNSLRNAAATFAAFTKRVGKAFFDVNEDDTTMSTTAKVAKTSVQRTIYAIADYWLMAASAVFIVVMDKQFGYNWLGLFLLMWAFDLLVTNVFIVIWKRTGEDVTLGESYRRAVDTIHDGSKIAGYAAFTSVIVKACFWDGPEHIVIFFNKEIRTEVRMQAIILVLTAVQAAIWTPIYVLGFDSVTQLFGYVRNLF